MNFKIKGVYLASMTVSRIINAYRDPSKLQYQRILVIKEDEIGDMCYSTHVFQMLRRQFPDAKITLICKSYGKALIKSTTDIDLVSTSWDELKEKFDLIVDLGCEWKSIFFALKNWPKTRLDRGTVRILDAARGEYPHEVITNLRVVEPIISPENRSSVPFIPLNENDRSTAAAFISKHQLVDFAVLHISARRTLRKWPLKNFGQLAEYLFNEKKLMPVFIGDESEAGEIAEQPKGVSGLLVAVR